MSFRQLLISVTVVLFTGCTNTAALIMIKRLISVRSKLMLGVISHKLLVEQTLFI